MKKKRLTALSCKGVCWSRSSYLSHISLGMHITYECAGLCGLQQAPAGATCRLLLLLMLNSNAAEVVQG